MRSLLSADALRDRRQKDVPQLAGFASILTARQLSCLWESLHYKLCREFRDAYGGSENGNVSTVSVWDMTMLYGSATPGNGGRGRVLLAHSGTAGRKANAA